MVTKKLRAALEALTSLGDPVRRRLYEAVAAAGTPVSRSQLAQSTGVARPLVAYHLDRLVKDGLVAARFERQTGRTGPGAGRPAKLYFRPRSPVQVALPPRDFELAARILLEALAKLPHEETEHVLDELAQDIGEQMAREQLEAGEGSESAVLARIVEEQGYEPLSDEQGRTCVRNCVFHELAEQRRELVCSMNHSLFKGMLRALPSARLEARLEPGPGRCCVVLVPAEAKPAS
jgi:predicted ArsR family transcriptional regulator